MSFVKNFVDRGYFHQCTNLDNLTTLMENEKTAAYVGFDCTAMSLHVGSLMQIMILRLLQQHGHKPIIIIGGATSKIGDPTGRDESRKVLTDEEIEENTVGIVKSLSKFLKFGSGKSDAIILDNSTWLKSINYMDFLRDYGKLFSINRMLTMDSVKLRLSREQPMTFLEFNYMILQAYDFYHLNKSYNCVLQFGGSDQWGNIVTGVEFVRKTTNSEVYGITTPLLTTSSGAKMGKSASGAVWLNEDMLSPYDYYQYWRNTEDQDVVRFAKLYCEFDANELDNFKNLVDKDINQAKKVLAHKVTELCHGVDAADNSMEAAIKVFEEGNIDLSLPTIYISKERLDKGIAAFELFFEAGLAESKSESKRLIRGGGARVNNIKVEDENELITNQMMQDNVIKLSAGRKKHVLIVNS